MTIYEEYSKLKIQIKAATARLKEVEPEILGEIMKLSAPMKTEFGLFTKVVRESWKYTEKVIEAEKKLSEKKQKALEEVEEKFSKEQKEIEALKAEEQNLNKAEKIENVGLRFVENK